MTMPITKIARVPFAVFAISFAAACSDEARVVTDTTEPSDIDQPAATDGDHDGETAPDSSGGSGSEEPGSIDETGSNGGTSGEPGKTDSNGEPTPFSNPRGACETSARVGRFSVEKQIDFGVIQGVVSEGVVPTAIPNVVAEAGRCRLLERRNLACLPACVGAETCGELGSCIPYPRQVSVGEVSLLGLTREIAMSPLSPGNSYFSPGADNPPYEIASQIVLSAAGEGSIPEFQLFGIGSEPLPEAPSWVLEVGSELVLDWAALTTNVATTVLVELTIDQHGITPLSLSCEFEDTGSATVPAAIIDRLISSGVTGFPNGRITRRTADHVELEIGCVELVVGSPLAASVGVAGFTPCSAPSDCPMDKVCNLTLQRCE